MSEWFSWSNMFYLIGIILAGGLTMVASKYTTIVKEMKEVAKVLEEAYEDGHLSKKEKESVMKECLDVVKSVINLKWKIF
jgi:20S proteasome alpha/beta subunit